MSAYVCQCVTERECVSGEPRVSVSPSVSEMHWNAGEEGACLGESGWLTAAPGFAFDSPRDLEWSLPCPGPQFPECNMRLGSSWAV